MNLDTQSLYELPIGSIIDLDLQDDPTEFLKTAPNGWNISGGNNLSWPNQIVSTCLEYHQKVGHIITLRKDTPLWELG